MHSIWRGVNGERFLPVQTALDSSSDSPELQSRAVWTEGRIYQREPMHRIDSLIFYLSLTLKALLPSASPS